MDWFKSRQRIDLTEDKNKKGSFVKFSNKEKVNVIKLYAKQTNFARAFKL